MLGEQEDPPKKRKCVPKAETDPELGKDLKEHLLICASIRFLLNIYNYYVSIYSYPSSGIACETLPRG